MLKTFLTSHPRRLLESARHRFYHGMNMFNTRIKGTIFFLVKFNFVEKGGSTGKRGIQTSSACGWRTCWMTKAKIYLCLNYLISPHNSSYLKRFNTITGFQPVSYG